MRIDFEAHHALGEILEGQPFLVRVKLQKLMGELEVTEWKKESQARTDSQHRALFLWFGQIEQVCANQGVTADMIFRHTHQIAITKNVLHEMCKTLAKALFGITSTKDIEKTGHIDKLIDHFVDLFAKEGVELPPFPSNEALHNPRLTAMENAQKEDYPDHTPTAFDEPTVA